MEKLKLMLVALPFLAILGLWQWQSADRSKTLPKTLRPKIVGKWIVGHHPSNLNDQDTLDLQVALNHAYRGDTILLRPGSYTISNFPDKDITLRGLTGNVDDVKVLLKKTIELSKTNTQFENLFFSAEKFQAPLIAVHEGKVSLDNVKIKSTTGQILISATGKAKIVANNNHLIGNGQAAGIMLADSTELLAENNKLIRFTNGIITKRKGFKGKVSLKNLEVSHCKSAGLFISGGLTFGENINVYKSATGLLFSDSAKGVLTNIITESNEVYGVDVLSGSQLKIIEFEFKHNREAGIHSAGKNSITELELGFISHSKLAYFAEDFSVLNAKNISLGDQIISVKEVKRNGLVQLGNKVTN